MTEFYQAKFKELFIEFTRYLTEHPEFAAHIPKDAEVILLDSKDPNYSLETIKNAEINKQSDDHTKRPVVYIEVREKAPVKSRLRKVKILESPPEYAVV